jgi:two-component system phosphate regulon response regulator PhoB
MTGPETGPQRVLVVEDEPDIAALLAYHLTREGYRVETATTGQEGLAAVNREAPDLMVLDLMLPGVSGLDVLRAVRSEPVTEDMPVLVLTALREAEDRILGFQLGADDYLTKPFSPKELVLRVGAILRRSRQLPIEQGGKVVKAGPVTMNLGALTVTMDGALLNLTPTEYRLLQAFLERPGKTQSRKRLLEEAWKVDRTVAGRLQTRTVDMHVRRLRSKLGEVGDWIETVRGFGYRFQPPPPGPSADAVTGASGDAATGVSEPTR